MKVPRPEPSLRARALRMLMRREHSRSELRRRLTAYAESAAELDALLDALEENKQLSDARYAESRANVLGRKYGSGRVAHELRRQGVDVAIIEGTVEEARRSDLVRARAAWRRKFGTPPSSRVERGKQIRFLLSRGFTFDIARVVLESKDDEA